MTTTTSTALATDDVPGVLVKTSVGDVHVVFDGDVHAAVVVACVHGLPGSARDFIHLGRELRRRGACAVRFDMPGFGRSPPLKMAPSSTLYAPQQRAAVVAEVMQRLGHRRYAVVGHSFGGTAALATAASFEAVTALALICSVGVTRHRGLTIPHEITRQLAGIRELPVVGARLAAPFIDVVRQTTERLGVRGERPFSDDEIVDQMQLLGGIDYADLRGFARRVRVPALVMSAEDDRILERAVPFTLAAALTSSPLVTHHHRTTGGHFLQKRAAAAIADWLTIVG